MSRPLSIPHLSQAQAIELGKRIWRNECAGRIDQLTFWNKNEPFPSFGIGHFVWLPEHYNGPYTQTFPRLITYLKKNKVAMPQWLLNAHFCPWENRNIFYEQFESEKMVELRNLLASTVAQQAQFIVYNFKKRIKDILQCVAKNEREKIKQHFNVIAHTKHGLYILIDYQNFKGTGANLKESYQGHRWGLLQVLQEMDTQTESPCQAFVTAAKKLLAQRVAHACEKKPEKQFLAGWYKRLETYLN